MSGAAVIGIFAVGGLSGLIVGGALVYLWMKDKQIVVEPSRVVDLTQSVPGVLRRRSRLVTQPGVRAL